MNERRRCHETKRGTNTIKPTIDDMSEVTGNLEDVEKIVVHAGDAHLDEFFACAIAFAKAAKLRTDTRDGIYETLAKLDIPIERHDPFEAELEDPKVLVLDVGGRLEPAKMNFDHHQLPRGSRDCTYTILAKHLWCGEMTMHDLLAEVYSWYETRAFLDSCGPFAATHKEGTDWSIVEKFLGPCEEFVLKQFAAAEPADRGAIVKALAVEIVEKAQAWTEVVERLNFPVVEGCVEIVDFTRIDPEKASAVSDAILRRWDCGVAMFHDNCGPGLTFIRLKDDPRVDFSRVKNDPRVAFVHTGGFLAKTKSKNIDDAFDLIAAACSAT